MGTLALSYEGIAQSEGRGLDFGGFVGASQLHADAPSGFLSGKLPTLGLSLRLNRNLRFSWQTSLVYQRFSGSTKGLASAYPAESSFATNMLSLSFGGEYHWYPYGGNYSYLGTKAWTPYIGAGLGLAAAWEDKFVLTPLLYLSAGLKYQISPRLQAILSYTWQYHTSDRLDALSRRSTLDAPFGQRASVSRHGDSSSHITLGLSWRLKYKHLNCN